MTRLPEAELVAEYVTARAGIVPSDSRRPELVARIVDAMAGARATSARQFCQLLEDDAGTFDELLATLTVGESYFFREPSHIDLLRRRALPERTEARGVGGAIRIWSAGCAAGQEAYTLAIVLEEEGLALRSHVLATDVSRQALDTAREGLYGKWSLRALDQGRRQTWFRPAGVAFRIEPRLASRITFRQHNLLGPGGAPARDLDVVLCRNVLVYLSPGAVERVGHMLLDSLAPGGWLVTASTDPRLEGIDGLRTVVTPDGIAYRRIADEPRRGPTARAGPPALQGRRADHGMPPRPAHTRPVRPRPPLPAAAGAAPPDPACAPDDPVAGDRLAAARSALADGDYAKAATGAAEVVGAGDHGDADVVLVRALGSAGRFDAASDAASLAVKRLPLHVELRLLQAIVLLESGRAVEASAAARAALYLDSELAMAHLTLARAEHARGAMAAAIRCYRNARSLLEAMPADEAVPFSDGESAARLAAMARAGQRAVAQPTAKAQPR